MKNLLNIIKNKIEYPYKKYLNWKIDKISKKKRISARLPQITIWDLLLFYFIVIGIITISLALFVGCFLIIKDIFT